MDFTTQEQDILDLVGSALNAAAERHDKATKELEMSALVANAAHAQLVGAFRAILQLKGENPDLYNVGWHQVENMVKVIPKP